MRWYRNLYLGPNAAGNIRRIREKAAAGEWMAYVYYVTLPSSAGQLLDIFHNAMLLQPFFADRQCTDIVGVAEGKAEAYELARRILEEIYGQTGAFDGAAFFLEEDFRSD